MCPVQRNLYGVLVTIKYLSIYLFINTVRYILYYVNEVFNKMSCSFKQVFVL